MVNVVPRPAGLRRRARLAGMTLILVPTTLAGQTSAAYRPASDTTTYRSHTTRLEYTLQGSDTVGRPTEVVTRESHISGATSTGLAFWVQVSADGGRPIYSVDIYQVAPNGRVLAVNDRPVGTEADERVDLLPRLPADPVPLEVGVQWTDTLAVSATADYGETWHRVRRSYRVAAELDTLGTTLLVFVARGHAELRRGGWRDSSVGASWWQEVSGPVTDTVWFDSHRDQLYGNATYMDLTGHAGTGARRSSEVQSSGLRVRVRRMRLMTVGKQSALPGAAAPPGLDTTGAGYFQVLAEGAAASDATIALQDEAENRTVWLERQPVLTLADVAVVVASPGIDEETFRVFARLTPPGEQRFEGFTEGHIGRRVGVVLGGRLLLAPVIRTPTGGPVPVIWEEVPRAEADALAKDLNERIERIAIEHGR